MDLAIWRYPGIDVCTHLLLPTLYSLSLTPYIRRSIFCCRNEPFLAPVGKKKPLRNLYATLLKKFPTKLNQKSLVMYHSDTKDAPCPHLEEHLRHSLDIWAGLKGVLMTSAVSVGSTYIQPRSLLCSCPSLLGADCSVPDHFKKIFLLVDMNDIEAFTYIQVHCRDSYPFESLSYVFELRCLRESVIVRRSTSGSRLAPHIHPYR